VLYVISNCSGTLITRLPAARSQEAAQPRKHTSALLLLLVVLLRLLLLLLLLLLVVLLLAVRGKSAGVTWEVAPCPSAHL
jgi:hypothetical protein